MKKLKKNFKNYDIKNIKEKINNTLNSINNSDTFQVNLYFSDQLKYLLPEMKFIIQSFLIIELDELLKEFVLNLSFLCF